MMNNVNSTFVEVGTIVNLLDSNTVTASVVEFLGEFSDLFDISAIVEDYRAEIAALAPLGLDLAGNIIIAAVRMDSSQVEAAMEAWHDAIVGIDFWAIVAKHDYTKAL